MEGQSSHEGLMSEMDVLQQSICTLQEENEALKEELESGKSLSDALHRDLEDCETREREYQTREKLANDHCSELQRMNDESEEKFTQLLEEHQQLLQREKELRERETNYRDLETEFNTLENQFCELRDREKEFQQKEESLLNAVSAKDTQYQHLHAKFRKLQDQVEPVQAKLEDLQTQHEDLQESHQSLTNEYQALLGRYQDIEHEYNELVDSEKTARDSLTELEVKYTAKVDELAGVAQRGYALDAQLEEAKNSQQTIQRLYETADREAIQAREALQDAHREILTLKQKSVFSFNTLPGTSGLLNKQPTTVTKDKLGSLPILDDLCDDTKTMSTAASSFNFDSVSMISSVDGGGLLTAKDIKSLNELCEEVDSDKSSTLINVGNMGTMGGTAPLTANTTPMPTQSALKKKKTLEEVRAKIGRVRSQAHATMQSINDHGPSPRNVAPAPST
eukprot:TRINITY_DN76206_c0_g1_i1.p1 TRINITY_DN76206_c0_g1~~TRINITY_DN76206_c0_g1_i1.p1  ORF type:complete len:484 (+),score=88.30 TRINITY_DN76206_c0_g1_i1:100-1452(+)